MWSFCEGIGRWFEQVRTAGVDSLCELANQNPVFAQMSIKFLVDMFNDEIESVLLNSINSLIKLHEHVDLRVFKCMKRSRNKPPSTTMLKYKQPTHDNWSLGNGNTLLYKAFIQGHTVNSDILVEDNTDQNGGWYLILGA